MAAQDSEIKIWYKSLPQKCREHVPEESFFRVMENGGVSTVSLFAATFSKEEFEEDVVKQVKTDVESGGGTWALVARGALRNLHSMALAQSDASDPTATSTSPTKAKVEEEPEMSAPERDQLVQAFLAKYLYKPAPLCDRSLAILQKELESRKIDPVSVTKASSSVLLRHEAKKDSSISGGGPAAAMAFITKLTNLLEGWVVVAPVITNDEEFDVTSFPGMSLEDVPYGMGISKDASNPSCTVGVVKRYISKMMQLVQGHGSDAPLSLAEASQVDLKMRVDISDMYRDHSRLSLDMCILKTLRLDVHAQCALNGLQVAAKAEAVLFAKTKQSRDDGKGGGWQGWTPSMRHKKDQDSWTRDKRHNDQDEQFAYFPTSASGKTLCRAYNSRAGCQRDKCFYSHECSIRVWDAKGKARACADRKHNAPMHRDLDLSPKKQCETIEDSDSTATSTGGGPKKKRKVAKDD
jgi:hypothetical protein